MTSNKIEKRAKTSFLPAEMRTLDRSGHDQALQRFFTGMKEDEWIQALHHSGDPRVVQLLGMLFDPNFAEMTFTHLCRECGLALGDMIDVFRRFKLDQGILEMANRAPDILRDTAEDAKSQKAVCLTCQGEGSVEGLDGKDDQVCAACMGDGGITIPGHDKARDLFFKTMGLTDKKAPLIAQQFNIGTEKMPKVEDLVNAASKE